MDILLVSLIVLKKKKKIFELHFVSASFRAKISSSLEKVVFANEFNVGLQAFKDASLFCFD